ncbi:unnamed protein product, partial [Meganyctiphanes norvegica]
ASVLYFQPRYRGPLLGCDRVVVTVIGFTILTLAFNISQRLSLSCNINSHCRMLNSFIENNYIPFNEHINTRRHQHALDYIGQKILFHILESLVIGNLGNILEIIKKAVGVNKPLTRFFTDVEIFQLEQETPSSWDITLLYKVIQKVCGLAPVDSGEWSNKEDGDKTLESLLFDLKELRNRGIHNSHLQVLSSSQLQNSLEELKTLSMEILDALIETATERRMEIDVDREEGRRKYVEMVIADVKKKVVEPK